MSSKLEANADFFVLQLAHTLELPHIQKWLAEISSVINQMGGLALIPGRIGRTEPGFRRAGAKMIDEPLDEDMRRGAFKRLKDISVSNDVSAYIAFDSQSIKIAQKLAKVHKAPIIFICQEWIPKASLFKVGGNSINLSQIDHFIVPSLTLSDHLMSVHEIEKSRISFIKEGIDLKAISDQTVSHERAASLAHSWGAIEEAADIVLIPAAYGDQKWARNLLKFFNNWSKLERKDTQFVVIGDDDGKGLMSQIQSQVYRQSPTAPVRLAGHCADTEAAIKLSTLILHIEGEEQVAFPLALTAQALGRFAILPDQKAAAEFVQDGKSGLLYNSDGDDICEIVQAVILRSESQRKSEAMAGRLFVTQNFSRDQMLASLRQVFENDDLA